MKRDDILAFDLYGTLVDPIGISHALRELITEDSTAVAELWRATQIDYAFRLTIMESYEDFAWVTARALDFALEAFGQALSTKDRHLLIDEYNGLAPFQDVIPGLALLRSKGLRAIVLSNGSSSMIPECLKRSGLGPFFDTWISTDDVRAYKPQARVYRHAADVVHRPITDIWLISSNPFDVVGAARAGMKTAWLNRGGRPFDAIGAPPDVIVSTISDLTSAL
jgi:2-haloacid dehalogenase